VTTGTAAHTDPGRALRNAILELVQIDAAMGHWYSPRTAPEIVLGARARSLRAVLDRRWPRCQPQPRFFWLQSPDLPGTAVACLIAAAGGGIPAVAVGLGIDLDLSRALYASLLEAVGVVDLAKIVALYDQTGADGKSGQPIDPGRIFDLETNVVYYAQPENAAALTAKLSGGSIRDEETPPDAAAAVEEDLALLVRGFAGAGKRLFFLDLTAPEIRDLGFSVVRVWSPELLSLCLPSAPPLLHPRLRAYGGGAFPGPHPYP
jgi:thiazole/oxazole-forming peptide maturase SagD family component